MPRISVIAVSPLDNSSWRYNVEIFENNGSGSKTSYQVTLDKEYYMDLTEKDA
jgi:hypothetical protein